MAMYERIKMMEERIPMNPRPSSSASRAEQRLSGTLDEGSLDLLEHLISTVLQGNSKHLQDLLQHEEILDVLDVQDNKGFTALHIASERCDTTSVRLLLLAGANPNVIDRFGRSALHWTVSGGCHCDTCNTKRAKCAGYLLEAKANVEAEDLKGETPLAYAAKNMFHKTATLILEHGADISRACKGVNTGHLVVQKIPEVMVQLLDGGIAYDEDDNSKLKLDFGVLIDSTVKTEEPRKILEEEVTFRQSTSSRHTSGRETELISCMLKAHPIGREELLTHPLTEAFLHLKWLYVRKWFWFLRFFYSSLTLVYTYFVFNLYVISCPFSSTQDNSSSSDLHPGVQNCTPSFELYIIAICIGSAIVLMILGELYEVCHDAKSYCTTGINFGWWLLFLGVGISLLPPFGVQLMDWQYTVAALSLFYAWAMNLAHIGRIPYFGAYADMLGKVLQKLVIVFFTYFSLFVAFVVGFSVLYPKSSFFEQIPKSMLKIFLMAMGDRDYPTIFDSTEEVRLKSLEYSIPVHIFYVGFLIIFGIVIMNLLMALAVNDIQDLQRKAELSLVIRQITEIATLESFLSSKLFSQCFTSFLLSKISVRTRNGRYFRFSPTDPEDFSLPCELKQKFIPFLNTRPCLKKRVRPMLLSNGITPIIGTTSGGQGLSRAGMGIGNVRHGPENLDDILNELRMRLEGLQRRTKAFKTTSKDKFELGVSEVTGSYSLVTCHFAKNCYATESLKFTDFCLTPENS